MTMDVAMSSTIFLRLGAPPPPTFQRASSEPWAVQVSPAGRASPRGLAGDGDRRGGHFWRHCGHQKRTTRTQEVLCTDAISVQGDGCEALVNDEKWWRICRLAEERRAFVWLDRGYLETGEPDSKPKGRRSLMALLAMLSLVNTVRQARVLLLC